jgi:hypothetical protein
MTGTKSGSWRALYRRTSLLMAVVFGAVGILFLAIPVKVLTFFNAMSPALGFRESPVPAAGFYLVLAVAYMVVVTLLACRMARHPDEPAFPALLVHAKSASSILSFVLFAFHGPFLIYAVNGVVDGLIALAVFLLFRKVRGEKA